MKSIMRKPIMLLGMALLALLFIGLNFANTELSTLAQEQQHETPSYAKWGLLAVKETKLKYPNADIIDYLHQGREVNGDTTFENFKLWLKEGDKEFGVFIRIEFISDTEELVGIEFEETSR